MVLIEPSALSMCLPPPSHQPCRRSHSSTCFHCCLFYSDFFFKRGTFPVPDFRYLSLPTSLDGFTVFSHYLTFLLVLFPPLSPNTSDFSPLRQLLKSVPVGTSRSCHRRMQDFSHLTLIAEPKTKQKNTNLLRCDCVLWLELYPKGSE